VLPGVAVEGLPTAHGLHALAEYLGWRPALVNFFAMWPAPERREAAGFPRETVEAVRAVGAFPVLTWEPMWLENGEERAVPGREILAGEWDGYLDRFAGGAASWGGPLVLRFAHEPNLRRYHWGTDEAGYGPASPALYRRMFRHVRQRFRAAGADNVRFAFCPNAESVPSPRWDPDAAWNTAAAWYPGDDVVDLLAMDGYNWGATRTVEEHGWQSRWQSFADIFGPLRAELRALAPGKPLLVLETASAAQGGDKAAWAAEALETARRWGLVALCWFQADKETEWALSGASRGAFAAGLHAGGPPPEPPDWLRP
jgi:hypothetical protein